ncbi:hypothetical protein CMI47_04690 [Candidatus Pacearchaeota archaeon]|jgi:hypothetical protein|nr:hypothetical protein [Candidatus Pacearchaeota archaeon]|tara:strand:+ start:14746 stop:15294 length:549 start_codon:yes stop_codon:yes gene_type:complete
MIVDDIISGILHKNSIVEYLSNRGITPKKRSGNRYIYNSPLPQVKGSDSTPSFFVYDKDGYQDFFCYSSKIGGNIITLHSCMSGKGFVESLKDFHDFQDIDDIALQIAIDKISGEIGDDEGVEFDCEFLKLSLSIRNLLRMQDIENNTDLISIWEKMEDIIISEDISDLDELNSEILNSYAR